MEQERRRCRCPLCGAQIVAEREEDCVDHMKTCAAFRSVHPDAGDGTAAATNFDYFSPSPARGGNASPVSADRGGAQTITLKDLQGPAGAQRAADMSIRELKTMLRRANLPLAGCVEKEDLVALALRAAAAAEPAQSASEPAS